LPLADRALPRMSAAMEFPGLRGRSILVVEDEMLIGMDIRTALEKAGATVTATTTVHHALILVEHE
jgi:CheY-like chemotaxis protein